MKARSFLPAVTQMIYYMQLQDKLYGVTFECPSIALQEKHKVVIAFWKKRITPVWRRIG